MRKYLGGAVALSLVWSHCAHAQTNPPSGLTETVVVTAQAPATQTLIDRKVYSISKDLQSNFGTAADVLNNIPSVTVDTDGNVNLRNDSNVTILIDGKPSTQFSGSTGGLSLQELSASDIDRIEIMTSPPASVKASGSAGVINIITKKHRQAGFSGDIRASAGEEGRFIAGADVAYNNGPFKSSLKSWPARGCPEQADEGQPPRDRSSPGTDLERRAHRRDDPAADAIGEGERLVRH